MSRRVIEWLKTGAIAVLLASALLLGYHSNVFAGLYGAFSKSSATSPGPGLSGQIPAEAARPGVIVLTNASTERAVFKYDMDAIDQVYQRTSGSFSDALRSLSTPDECSMETWQNALKLPGIMFEYHTSMPLELVRDWLGAPGEGHGVTLRRICLTFNGGTSALYFEDNGRFYMSAATILSGESVMSTSYTAGLNYLFEIDKNSAAPYMIPNAANSSHTTALCSNPLTDSSVLSNTMSALGIDLKQTSSYPETDGTRVFVSSSFVLFVSPTGVVTYRRSSDSNSEALDFCASVELARRTVALTIGSLSGEARVYYTGFSYDERAITVTFDYFFDGGRVFIPEQSSAAKVTIANGVVTDMTLCFRSFSQGSEMILLPEIQALAICDGEFSLGYTDSASSSPFWYNRESSRIGGAS